LAPHVFAYIYKLLYAYVYPYNQINMFLGCTDWYRFGSSRSLRNWEKMEVSQNSPLSLYWGNC